MSAIEELDGARVRQILRSESRRGVVIDFWSPWCAPCRALRPHLDKLARERSDWRFVAVNTEEHPAAAEHFEVESLPTLVFCRRGREIHRFAGQALVSTIAEALDSLSRDRVDCGSS